MSDLDKQIRLRATAEEKQHLETGADDAGYKNLSDYLRHVLFDKNVLIVGDGEHSGFVLVPAWSSVEEERTAALTNLQGLVQLAEELRAQTSGGGEPEAVLPPAAGPSTQTPEDPPAPLEERSPPPAAEETFLDEAPEPNLENLILHQVPDQAAPQATVLGPVPQPEESYDAFLQRRGAEIQLASGATPVRAGFEADAEWRAANNLAEPSVAPAAVAAQPTPGHGFCGSCGAELAGTAFCSGCGARVA